MTDFTKKEIELIKTALSEYRDDLSKVGFAFEGELKDLTLLIDKIKQHTSDEEKAELVKHGHLINLPKALDPSEQPVMCSVCKSVTSLYHGYKPKYCSNCGAKFDGGE